MFFLVYQANILPKKNKQTNFLLNLHKLYMN